MWRRWRRRRLEGRQAGSPGEQLAADYLDRRAEEDGRAGRCRATTDFRMPFTFTAGVKDGGSKHDRRATAGTDGVAISPVRQRAGAVVLRQRRSQRLGGVRRLRARRARHAELRLRQLRRPRREGQDRRRAALLPRGRRSEDARHPRRATPTFATRRMAARQRGAKGDARRHRTAIAERRRDDADDASTRRLPDRASSRPASAATPPRDLRGGRTNNSKTSRRSSTPAIRTSPASRFPEVTVTIKRGRASREADRPQRRRLPARDDGDHWREQAVGRARRALRPPGPRRHGNSLAEQGGRRQDSSRRRRQRLRHGRGARHRRGAQQAAAHAAPAARLLVGGGDRPDRVERFRHQAAGAGRSARRLLQLRHGRPDAGQQADRAGDRHQPRSGRSCSSRPTSRPAST